ncbi:hypothetical protein P22_0562 [Propionispora sp. 2/2-37]|uniref:O-antigen ligase family protein n=1 Tax=Propionispora sp. 2/2-37 TaxID=1677858 RepID=UPI0006BB5D6B|nr:O-antigen ligase family protein [Propionispora sp. 2/2-37]CUH94496.1 hypothetical protein P22_0562 [Propionispora sp. 2/2-37]
MKIYSLDYSVYSLLLFYALFSATIKEVAAFSLYLATLCAVIHHFKQPIIFAADKSLVRAIALFFLTALISIIFSERPMEGVGMTATLLQRMVLPFILVVGFIKQRRQFLRILVAMAVSLFIADLYAIWQGFYGNFRAAAFSEHPMTLAGYLLQMIPLLLVFFIEDQTLPRKYRTLFGIVLGVSTVALLFNGTRGAWIAVSLTLFFYGLLNIKRNPKYLFGFIALLMIIGIIAFNVPSLKHRIDSIVDKHYQSNSERLLMWHSAWNMFLDHPITGVGIGNYEKAYQEQYISPDAKERKQSHAHNNFLQVLADRGIIGFLGFIYLFGYILYSSYRNYSKTKNLWAIGIFLVTVSLLLQGLTEYNAGNSAVTRMYWFLIGLSFSAMNSEYESRKS